MTITIATIPHNTQRYNTVGDWQWAGNGNNLLITVSDMDNWKHELLVAIHELIEVMLCKSRGIKQENVDHFDMNYEKQRKENDLSEPGDSLQSPYYNEHQFATCLERLMAFELGVDWNEYDEKVCSL